MTIEELMREMDVKYHPPKTPSPRFQLWCEGPRGAYRAEVWVDRYSGENGEAIAAGAAWLAIGDSYEEVTEEVIETTLNGEGAIACSVCGNRHLPSVMLETDDGKLVCEMCIVVQEHYSSICSKCGKKFIPPVMVDGDKQVATPLCECCDKESE